MAGICAAPQAGLLTPPPSWAQAGFLSGQPVDIGPSRHVCGARRVVEPGELDRSSLLAVVQPDDEFEF